jgi:hypothetical protein
MRCAALISTSQQGEFFALLGTQWRRQNHADQHSRRPHPRLGRGLGVDHGVRCGTKQYREARRALGMVPQELVYDPFFTVRETLRLQSGYFGLRRNDDWIDELLTNLGLDRQGRDLHPTTFRRHEAAGAGGAGAGAQATGHRAGRTDCRGRCGITAILVAASFGRLNQHGSYHRADHALSGRSRNALPARRHVQGRADIVALDRTANLLHAAARNVDCCLIWMLTALPDFLAAASERSRRCPHYVLDLPDLRRSGGHPGATCASCRRRAYAIIALATG